MNINLSEEAIREQIIEAAARQLIDGDCEHDYSSSIERRVKELIQKKTQETIDQTIAKKFDEEVAPLIVGKVDGIILQQTNEWGEKKGATLTFTEYFIKRVEEHITEKVKSNGEKAGGYSSSNQTRITYLVDKHLHYEIEKVMKDALSNANLQLAQGIHEAVRIKLNELLSGLKVNVNTK